MADFSQNDINDAKERVREMRKKASSFIDNDGKAEKPNDAEVKTDNINSQNSNNFSGGGNIFQNLLSGDLSSIFSGLSKEGTEDNDFMIILILIFMLTKEGADNILILALLYLLF